MKKTLALVLAAVMTAGMTTTAFAYIDDYKLALGKDGNGTDTLYVMDDGVAKNVTSDYIFEGGDEIVLPIVMWEDTGDTNTYEASKVKGMYEDKDDVKMPKVYATWKEGEAEELSIETVKFGAGNYSYAVVVTVPDVTGNKIQDLVGDIMIGSSKSSAEKYDYTKYDLQVSYAPDGVDTYYKVDFDGGDVLESGKTGIVAFDKEAGEIDIEFGDETALFTVDVTGQGKLNLAWNTDFNKEVADLDKSANMDFVTFEGTPSFNKNGTLYIYADKDTYLYEIVDGKLVAVDAEYDEDYEAWSFKTRTLGAYVISDKELEEQVITDGDEDASSSTTEDGGKENPDTGR